MGSLRGAVQQLLRCTIEIAGLFVKPGREFLQLPGMLAAFYGKVL